MMQSQSPYESCAEVCGNLDQPGVGLDDPVAMRRITHDPLTAKTTIDQARIEAVLDTMELTGKHILHVGVGNSKLACRFASRVNVIDGLTISLAEKAHADGLQIDKYTVYLLNKYSREFIVTIKNKYHLIIDNNLASFACCKFHFYLMLDNYVWALQPDGSILTDQRGMDWVVEEPRWKLSYMDLVALEKKFPLKASCITDTVYALQRVK
jgi:hypothetical protein